MIIIIDVDDTVVNLVDTWLDVYNTEHNDSLTKEDIKDWDIGSYTKIKRDFYKYIKMPNLNLYYAATFVDNSLEIINKMKLNHEIFFCTAEDYQNRKLNLLIDGGFLKDDKNFIVARNKSMILGDAIIDDKYEYVTGFSGNIKILFDQPWNRKYAFPDKYNVKTGHYRAKNWLEIGKLFGVVV